MAGVPGRRSGTLVIEGGTFKTASGSAVVKNEPTGVLTINGGEFSITRERAAERITRASLPTAFPKIMKSKTTATAPGPSPKSNSPDSNIQIGTPRISAGCFVQSPRRFDTPAKTFCGTQSAFHQNPTANRRDNHACLSETDQKPVSGDSLQLSELFGGGGRTP